MLIGQHNVRREHPDTVNGKHDAGMRGPEGLEKGQEVRAAGHHLGDPGRWRGGEHTVWRIDVDQGLLTYGMFGPYREDGLYLLPASAQLRTGQLQADFAINRSAFPVAEFPFPTELLPDWLRKIQNPDPVRGALPKLEALQNFLRKRTADFPIPASLPQTAEPKPSNYPDHSKPRSLHELFRGAMQPKGPEPKRENN